MSTPANIRPAASSPGGPSSPRRPRGEERPPDAAGGPAIDDIDVSKHVGKRVAEFRKLRGLKVAELARRIGVTGSLISQIERARARPSISTLFLLGEALDVPMDAFFRPDAPVPERPPAARAGTAGSAGSGSAAGAAAGRDEPLPVSAAEVHELRARGMRPRRVGPRAGAKRFVVRRDERATIEITGGVRWEQLTPGPVEEGEFLEAVYAPRSESSPELYRHPGSEWVLVLEGTLEITVGFTTCHLEPGDSMCFPSSLPHRYANPSDQPARVVSANLWDHGSRGGADDPRPSDA